MRTEISVEDAELVLLGSLERLARTGATVRDVEHELLSIDETRLSSGLVEVTLGKLHEKGLVSTEGPLDRRVYVISEKGRARLRGGRVA